MSEGMQEIDELTRLADATVLNIGTLHPRQVEYFLAAGRCANQWRKPVVLDPVGVGEAGVGDPQHPQHGMGGAVVGVLVPADVAEQAAGQPQPLPVRAFAGEQRCHPVEDLLAVHGEPAGPFGDI